MVHTTNNYSCPNVYMLFMSALYIYHEIAMLLQLKDLSVGKLEESCIGLYKRTQ